MPRRSAFSSAAVSVFAAASRLAHVSMEPSSTLMRISNFFSPGRSLANSLILGTSRNAVLMIEVADFQFVLAMASAIPEAVAIVLIISDISKVKL